MNLIMGDVEETVTVVEVNESTLEETIRASSASFFLK